MTNTDRAKDITDAALEKAGQFAEQAGAKAAEIAERARDRAPEVVDKVAEIAGKAFETAAAAVDKATGGRFHDYLDPDGDSDEPAAPSQLPVQPHSATEAVSGDGVSSGDTPPPTTPQAGPSPHPKHSPTDAVSPPHTDEES